MLRGKRGDWTMDFDEDSVLYTQCMSCGMIYNPSERFWMAPAFFERLPRRMTHDVCPNRICELDYYIKTFKHDSRIDSMLERLEERMRKARDDGKRF